VQRFTTAYLGRVKTQGCLVATSARRKYVLVMYVAMSMQH
jgi:hypothetical protein